MSDTDKADRLRQYEELKRENDEHLLISLTNIYPHDEDTKTVRANIALEIYGCKFTLCHLLREWSDRHKEIEHTFSDLNIIPSVKLDDKKAIRKAAIGKVKGGKQA